MIWRGGYSANGTSCGSPASGSGAFRPTDTWIGDPGLWVAADQPTRDHRTRSRSNFKAHGVIQHDVTSACAVDRENGVDHRQGRGMAERVAGAYRVHCGCAPLRLSLFKSVDAGTHDLSARRDLHDR